MTYEIWTMNHQESDEGDFGTQIFKYCWIIRIYHGSVFMDFRGTPPPEMNTPNNL